MTRFSPRPCRLFIFDLDGTLIDSKADIAKAVNLVLRQLNLPPLAVSRVQDFIGKGVRKLLERAFGEVYGQEPDEALIRRGLDLFREAYGRHLLDETRLYKNVVEALDRLAWADMAVVSNKPERYSRPILAGLGVAERFRCIFGEESTHAFKPDPTPLRVAMEFCGADSAQTVMIGDSSVDIEAGKAAAVTTCAVTGGYHSKEQLLAAGPDLVIDDLLQLGDYFHAV
jgi:phosphoglycolate phosphatase